MLASLAIVGCGLMEADLVIEAITPDPLKPDQTLILTGSGFVPSVEVRLENGQTSTVLDTVSLGKTRIEASVPMIDPGNYELVVSRPKRSVRQKVRVALHVEQPCRRGYTANTQVSLVAGLAILDKFHADGTRDRVETPIAEIKSLALSDTSLADGKRCSAIVFHLEDGSSMIFEDAVDTSLRGRASTLAGFLKKDLVDHSGAAEEGL